jgi:hypothetical protein
MDYHGAVIFSLKYRSGLQFTQWHQVVVWAHVIDDSGCQDIIPGIIYTVCHVLTVILCSMTGNAMTILSKTFAGCSAMTTTRRRIWIQS